MDLAEHIIEQNDKGDDGFADAYDLLWVPIPTPKEYRKNPDYIAARIMIINRTMVEDSGGYGDRLHRRGDEIWLGHKKLKEDADNIYKLSEIDWQIDQRVKAQVWARLHKWLPELDRTKIAIDRHTLFDIKSGEIIHTDKPINTVD